MTDRELMQQALDALEWCYDVTEWPANGDSAQDKAIEALRARLAQPEQEIEPDRDHVEDDGCPTEKAVLQRFWREHQKQEPVACPYCHYSHTLGAVFFDQNCAGCVNRMTTPPQRDEAPAKAVEWQGLTDEEILEEYRQSYGDDGNLTDIYFAHAIEAKLKEKNGTI